MSKQFDLKAIGSNFRILGDFVEGAPYGSGHINDTFAVTYLQGGTPIRYISIQPEQSSGKKTNSSQTRIKRNTVGKRFC